MDIGDLAVEKGLLSRERLAEVRRSLKAAEEKGLPAPALSEVLVLRGLLSRETANALTDELLIRSPEPPPEGRVAHYRLEDVIGEGASGVVYRAVDTRDGRKVALKVLPETLARNERYVKRFIREARSAAALRHPHLVSVYEVGRLGNTYFIAMELVEGRNLEDVLAERGKIPAGEALRITRQVAEALDAAFKAGIVHRDVKPGNIIIDDEGNAKLVDLGLAKRQGVDSGDATATADNVAIGTPAYMAPEQARDARRADHRADIYSLGATLFHMLTGRPPVGGGVPSEILVKVIEEGCPPIRSVEPSVPRPVAAVVDRMTAYSPEERFETPGRLLDALAALERGGAGRFREWLLNMLYLRRRTLAAAAALLIAAGLTGGVVWTVFSFYRDYREALEAPPRVTVVVPRDAAPPRPEPPRPDFYAGVVKDPEKTAREMLARINSLPRGTPREMMDVISRLKAFGERNKGTSAGKEALLDAERLEKVFREKRRKALASAHGGLNALVLSMRYDAVAKAIQRLQGRWGPVDYTLMERSGAEEKRRAARRRRIEEGVRLLLDVGLVSMAKREIDLLNRFWECDVEADLTAGLYRDLEAARSRVSQGVRLAEAVPALRSALARLASGEKPGDGELMDLGAEPTMPAEELERFLEGRLKEAQEAGLFYTVLPGLYLKGELDVFRRKLGAIALRFSTPAEFPPLLRKWGDVYCRTEAQRRALGVKNALFSPLLLVEPSEDDWVVREEPKVRSLPFTANALVVMRSPGRLEIREAGGGGETVLEADWSGMSARLKVVGPSGASRAGRFDDVRSITLWGNECVVEAYDGTHRLEVKPVPRVRVFSDTSPPGVLALADEDEFDSRLRQRRSRAAELLASLPAGRAYPVLERDFPDCRKETAEAALAYAKWLGSKGKTGAAVEILMEAAVFCPAEDLGGMKAAVEKILSRPIIDGR